MRAYFFWKDCGVAPAPLGQDQRDIWLKPLVDVFFVGATHDEARESIRPLMSPAYQVSLDALFNAGADGFVDFGNGETDMLESFERDGRLYFIVARDLSRVIPWMWVYPISGMWGQNPWKALGDLVSDWPTGVEFAGLGDLAELQVES